MTNTFARREPFWPSRCDMIEYVVTENLSEQRLDKVLKKILAGAPDSFIYRQLREKNITLNKKRAQGSDRTKEGDVIRFFFSEETYRKMRALSAEESPEGSRRSEDHPLNAFPKGVPVPEVLYEDKDVLLFIKPKGLDAQKAQRTGISANDWVLLYYAEKHPETDDGFRPSVVNRLDRNTSGIMAAGLSAKGLRVLSRLLRERDLHKRYLTIVIGEAPEKADEKAFLGPSDRGNQVVVRKEAFPGSAPIETRFERLCYDPVKDLSLLDVELVTGKKHQIRAHLSALGYPVLGDPKYGDPKRNRAFGTENQYLFCYRMEFPECDLEGLSGKAFSAPAPKDWPLRPEGEPS